MPEIQNKNISTLTERLFGIFSNYAFDKTEAGKNEIIKATERDSHIFLDPPA